MNAQSTPRRWQAELHLEFAQRDARTALVRRHHRGPLAIQKSFYPEGPVCHSYLLHPPGGIAGGDALDIHITVGRDAHALVTTPAAGKFYRSDGTPAGITQVFDVAAGATLEWLPQENIVFPGSLARQTTQINITGNARCVAWEVTCLGRPACGETFNHGSFQQSLELHRDGAPVLIERNLFIGASPFMRALWGMGGNPVIGTLLATGGDARMRDALRYTCAEHALTCQVTLVEDLLICRTLGTSARVAQHNFQILWQCLRPALLARAACTPRIWLT